MTTKHALIIFGEYRTFETASKFWNIPDNIDIFVSTWDFSAEKRVNWIEFDDVDNDWKIKLIPDFYKNGSQLNYTYEQEVNRTNFSSLNPLVLKIHPYENRNKYFNTANQIYHWKSALEDINHQWDKYENIYIFRIDSVQLPNNSNFSMWENAGLYNLKDNSIYTQSHPNFENGTFFNDNWIYGKKESIKTWINHLDAEKHKVTHEGLAIATKELIDKKILNHIPPNNHLHGAHTDPIRRGMATMWDSYYDNWKKSDSFNKFETKYLPLIHPNYEIFKKASDKSNQE
jgi:hypothetical protein